MVRGFMVTAIAAVSALIISGCALLPPDLVMSCSFDAEGDVLSPLGGAKGSFQTLELVDDAVKGKALAVPAGKGAARFALTNGLPAEVGRIDFSLKLLNVTDKLAAGADPRIFMAVSTNAAESFSEKLVGTMEFSARSAGGTGLCVTLGEHSFSSGTGRDLARVFSIYNPRAWHGYRIAWNVKGLVTDPGKAVVVKLDGRTVASLPLEGFDAEKFVKSMSRPADLLIPLPLSTSRLDFSKSPFLIDELSIWSSDCEYIQPAVGGAFRDGFENISNIGKDAASPY